jgi:hypothetical protein
MGLPKKILPLATRKTDSRRLAQGDARAYVGTFGKMNVKLRNRFQRDINIIIVKGSGVFILPNLKIHFHGYPFTQGQGNRKQRERTP